MHRAQIVVGTVLIVGALIIAGNIGWFYLRSSDGGGRLVAYERAAIGAARNVANVPGALTDAACRQLNDSSTAPQGLLEAAQIGMQAPVLSGDADTQLNVAVGHVPNSAWPGQPGTTILAAHDVTYFSEIDQLQSGAEVDYVTPCVTYRYVVTGDQVISVGTPIYSTPGLPTLVLETCYPTDALFLTNQRFILEARFVSALKTGHSPPIVTAPPVPVVPAPKALSDEGLTLVTNSAQLGVLTVTGSPIPTWQQSIAPFDDQSAVLTAYFGAVRSAEQLHADWWGSLTQSVPVSSAASLAGASIGAYATALDVTLAADGSTLTGAALDAHIRVVGGHAPGEYALHVTLTNIFGTLLITGWSMAPI